MDQNTQFTLGAITAVALVAFAYYLAKRKEKKND